MGKSITFLTDDPPLKSKGAGISVLLYNILLALEGSYSLNVITFCRTTKARCKEIQTDNATKQVFICDRVLEKCYPHLKLGILKVFFEFVSFFLSIPLLIKKNNFDSNVCVTIVGASVKPICKAWFLMLFVRKAKHCIYIVDDLELINQKQGNKLESVLFKLFFKRTILKADILISITEVLNEKYKNYYGKDGLVLQPHFKKVEKLAHLQEENNIYNFIFTGGLSFLYNDSLVFFASAIEKINKENLSTLSYRLIVQTYSPIQDFEVLNFNKDYVSFSTSEDRNELLEIYQKSDCFLIPYSFSEDTYNIVTTSFPQKIAEIIQYGRNMFFLGPEYSSVGNFFIRNKLKYTCNILSMTDLKKTIVQCSNDRDNNYVMYENAYQQNLSANVVLNVFDKIMNTVL